MKSVVLDGSFDDDGSADDAIVRLNVLGVPNANIRMVRDTSGKITVTAEVEDRLSQRAADILRRR